MAFNREDWEARRLLRRQQKQQRQAQKRRLLIRFGAAVVVLALCAGLIVFLTQRDTPDTSLENTATTAEQEATTVVHLAAAGDLNITDRVVESGGSGFDYTDAFLDVAHLLADADVSVLNFEGCLLGAPYGTESGSAPASMLQALKSAGVDMVQLANSYSIRQGTSGLVSTIDAVTAAGMIPVGVYRSNSEFQQNKGYSLCVVNGVKIAFVAFTKGMDGLALPAGSEDCVNVLYTDYASAYQEVDTEGITAVLDAAQREKPDITVALLHWGSEFNDTISQSQQEICELMKDNGVDAIIGTHSHYVQKMEFDKDSGQFVAYSLGDFFGSAERAGSEYSVVLDLEITKDNRSGKTKITKYSYTPIFTVAEEKKPLKVVRLQQAMQAYEKEHISKVAPETYAAMQNAWERIEKRVKGE